MQSGKANLQELFLLRARRDKVPVTMFLMNGFQMRGTITGYDAFMVVLEGELVQRIEQGVYHYHRGDACLLGRNARHGEQHDRPFYIVFLNLAPDYVRRLLDEDELVDESGARRLAELHHELPPDPVGQISGQQRRNDDRAAHQREDQPDRRHRITALAVQVDRQERIDDRVGERVDRPGAGE